MTETKKTKKNVNKGADKDVKELVDKPDIEKEEPEGKTDAGDVAEEAANEGAAGSAAEVNALLIERDEYKDALIRERADFENYKKRNADLAAVSFQNGLADAVMQILPVLDNFERAVATECSDEAFLSGMEMIKRQLTDALASMGVTEIEADGATFDPEYHNAVMQVEEEGRKTNEIVEVMQKGYSMNGRVLRHSMVKVNK
ncbi:MAG: nucleotide exchange factor GrpE [Christensenellaceae bacterium]